MLALSLTVLVLLTISMAVNLHLHSFDKRRAALEQSQLARAVLRLIADDIRSVVQSYEQDTSGIETLMASTASESLGAVGDALGADTSGIDLDAAADSLAGADEESTNTQDLATGVTLSQPGIYGNQYELQIDISRLPREDEYQAMLLADPTTGLVDVPSDVKTVTYYVSTDAAAAQDDFTTVDNDPLQAKSGLFRRQLDRAVTSFAFDSGDSMGLRRSAELIAPEVVAVEFQYFDGYEWRPEWDTETEGVLPMAIQVVIALRTPERHNDEATAPTAAATLSYASAQQSTDSSVQYHRLLVRIPTGEPSSQTDTSTTTDTTTSDTTGTVP